MTMTRLMGSVLGADQKSADTDVETVETTAAWSSTLSADISPEIARSPGPGIAPKSVIT